MKPAREPSMPPIRQPRFTRSMRAQNACIAALAIAPGPDQIADAVADWMSGSKRGVRRLTRGLRKLQSDQARRFVATRYMPQSGTPEASDHAAAFAALLLRMRRSYEVSIILADLGLKRADYDHAMRLLSDAYPDCYANLLAGRFDQAMALLRTLPQDAVVIADAIIVHARLTLVHTTLDRMDLLRSLARHPMGDLCASTSTWPYVATIADHGLVEPAKLIGKYTEAAWSPQGRRLDGKDGRSIAMLQARALLPMTREGTALADIGLLIRARLGGATTRTRRLTERALRHASYHAAPVARLTPQMIHDAGWVRQPFARFICGLDGYECALFVARELLHAMSRIDVIVRRSIHAKARAPNAMKVRFLAEVLRNIAGCDPQASDAPDMFNHNGGKTHARMMQKLATPRVAKRVDAVLGIKVDTWFST